MLHDALIRQSHGHIHEPADFTHPADLLDPPESTTTEDLALASARAYLEAARAFLGALDKYAFYVLNHSDPRMAMWIIVYVHDLKAGGGRTQAEIGKICGLKTRQAVDKEVQRFCDATGYSPASGMKSPDAGKSYREARLLSIVNNQTK